MSIRAGGRRTKDEPISFFIVEHDIGDPLLSHGAIIFEQYITDSPEEVRERAKKFTLGGTYGRVWVGQVWAHDLRLLTPPKREDEDIPPIASEADG